MDIIYVEPDSPVLHAVQMLGDQNRNSLGFLPGSVFSDFSRNRQILAAVTNGHLAGYVAFVPVRRMMKIVHLCVAAESRNSGVASALIERLSDDFRESDGLIAHCRVDFAANAAWPKLGFIPIRERHGRSKKGSILVVWARRHDHPTLFSDSAEGLPRAVLDACLVYDLQDPETPETRETKALLSDWLTDDFELAVTDELFHEINRNPDPVERRRRWEFASSLERIGHDRSQIDLIKQDLAHLFPAPRNASDQSDYNQVSMAIAGDAEFFLTRDERLLTKGPEITRKWGIFLMRPSHLIGQSYEEKRKALYRPGRFAGTQITKAKPTVSELDDLADQFLAYGKGESKAQFNRIIYHAITSPDHQDIMVFREQDGTPFGLLVIDHTANDFEQVPLLRTTRARGSGVMARHLLWHSVVQASSRRSSAVVLRDHHYPEGLQPAFEAIGFEDTPIGWAKIIAPGLWPPEQLAEYLRTKSFSDVELPFQNDLATAAEDFITTRSLSQQLDLELMIWPGKIQSGTLPTFVVPIRAHWASQLFEDRIAGSDLFGAPPGLILRTENVYYRSKRGPRIREPSRVLWYVSDEKGIPYSKHVVGCSYVRELKEGSAKELFRIFERLGVYTWPDVRRIAGGTAEGHLMAFRFSHTELFRDPIPYESLKQHLESSTGKKITLRGPCELPRDCFDTLYRRQEGVL